MKLRKAILRLALVAVAGTGAVAGWVRLTRAESLSIRRIVVEGTGPERADEIRALLNLKPGDNLLFADLDLARSRAETHPWVLHAAVKRELPDALRLVVQERTVRLILALDRLYYLDATGEPFKTVEPGDAYDLPVLTGLVREDLLGRADVARTAIAGALELLTAIDTQAVPRVNPEERPTAAKGLGAADVSEIAWDADDGYSLVMVSGGLTVRLGNGDYGLKLARLREVRDAAKALGERDAKEIDLTYSSRVIVAR